MSYDLRKKVYTSLVEDTQIVDMVGERIFQASSFEEEVPPDQTPFLVYKMANFVPIGPSRMRAREDSVHIWVHDKPGDYYLVDQILDRVEQVFHNSQPEGPFLEFRFNERSPDLWDDVLKTIMRYSRYRCVLVEENHE